jgi:uncharacterized short protein YbdD (DUF466 family)
MKAVAIFERVWKWLRAVSGDAAYENYVRQAEQGGAEARLLSPREFYLDALHRRYNTVSRCC